MLTHGSRLCTHLNNLDHHVSNEPDESQLSEALHQDKQSSKEEKSSPLYLVEDGFQVLNVRENQQHNCSKDGNPTWKWENFI